MEGVLQLARSRQIRLVFTAGAGLLALALAVLAARHFAETPWPLSRGHPGLLVGGSIFLLATAWRTGLRLAPHHVAPAAVLGSRP